MNERDQFTGIFDHLDPDDFKKTHGPRRGGEEFAEWLADRLAEVRMAWASSDGHLNPITVIADSGSSVMLPATSEETLAQYRDRVRDEARRLHATWLFTARKTTVGYYDTTTEDDTLPDTTQDEKTIRATASARGAKLSEGVYYYAARHEGDETERKHGMIPNENGLLGETIEGNADAQSVSFYGDILA